MGMPDKKLVQALEELGETVVLTSSVDQAHEVLVAAAAKNSDYTVLDGGSLGIAFMTPTDAVVAVVRDDLGMRVQVERISEHHGFVMVAPKWKKLRKNIVKAAAAAHVPSSAGPAQTFTRGVEVGDNHVEWTLNA